MFPSDMISLHPEEDPVSFLLEQVCWWQDLLLFVLLRILKFCLRSWRIFLHQCRILGWHFFSFSIFKVFHYLLASIVSDENLTVIWIIVSSYAVCFFFFLAIFKMFSLTLHSRYLIVILLGVSLSLRCFWYAELLESVNLRLSPNLGSFLAIISSDIFFCTSLFSFEDSNDMNVGPFDIVLGIPDAVFLSFIFPNFFVSTPHLGRLDHFCQFNSKFIDSCPCHLCSTQFIPCVVFVCLFLISDIVFFSSKVSISFFFLQFLYLCWELLFIHSFQVCLPHRA